MPAPAATAKLVDQGTFDFLCPYRSPLLRPEQVAKTLGRGESFVYSMIEEGKLEVFAPQGREKKRYTITRRSVLLLMAEQAGFAPDDLVPRLAEVAATLSPAQWAQFLTQANTQRKS